MSKAAGWIVEVTDAIGVARYDAAFPIKADAEAAVRRRVTGGVALTVDAVSPLSPHEIYRKLRMKRGEIAIRDN
jgi:hypothetical protein